LNTVFNHPLPLFAVSIAVLWSSAWIASSVVKRRRDLEEEAREDFDLVTGAALTLLGLLIGFAFSMAIQRYDQRKHYEETEANAISTEVLRAGLLPPGDAAALRTQLRNYLDQRISFYLTTDRQRLSEINAHTAQLQRDLWSAVQGAASAQPNAIVGLALSGMNDVLNAQGFTQAAWWNRIPYSAWWLMALLAICCNLLVGYRARKTQTRSILLLILPLIVSAAFLLIADMDSPRGGLIHVHPDNLLSLAAALSAS
jgi:hypothetical protein